MNNLEELRANIHRLWSEAKKYESRRLSGLNRLKRFSLVTRMVSFKRFTKIRTMIRSWEERRSVAVMMALGGSRLIRRVERKQREQR